MVDINAKLAVHEAKLEELLPQSRNPPDVEDTLVQNQSSTTVPTTGKLPTADFTLLKKVTWPHEVMFIPEGRPEVYRELSIMAFVRGYLIVMDSQHQITKALMDSYLQDHRRMGGLQMAGCQGLPLYLSATHGDGQGHLGRPCHKTNSSLDAP